MTCYIHQCPNRTPGSLEKRGESPLAREEELVLGTVLNTLIILTASQGGGIVPRLQKKQAQTTSPLAELSQT